MATKAKERKRFCSHVFIFSKCFIFLCVCHFELVYSSSALLERPCHASCCCMKISCMRNPNRTRDVNTRILRIHHSAALHLCTYVENPTADAPFNENGFHFLSFWFSSCVSCFLLSLFFSACSLSSLSFSTQTNKHILDISHLKGAYVHTNMWKVE